MSGDDADKQLDEDLYQVLQTVSGRRVLSFVLGLTWANNDAVTTNPVTGLQVTTDPVAMAYCTGKQSVGQELLVRLQSPRCIFGYVNLVSDYRKTLPNNS